METLDTFSLTSNRLNVFVQAQDEYKESAPSGTAPIPRPRGGLDHAYGGVLHLLTLFFGDF